MIIIRLPNQCCASVPGDVNVIGTGYEIYHITSDDSEERLHGNQYTME